jgi:hypothetical protein
VGARTITEVLRRISYEELASNPAAVDDAIAWLREQRRIGLAEVVLREKVPGGRFVEISRCLREECE